MGDAVLLGVNVNGRVFRHLTVYAYLSAPCLGGTFLAGKPADGGEEFVKSHTYRFLKLKVV